MKSKSPTPSKALRHVYGAVYIQIFSGAGFLLMAVLSHRDSYITKMERSFGLLIFVLGMGIWISLREYEKGECSLGIDGEWEAGRQSE